MVDFAPMRIDYVHHVSDLLIQGRKATDEQYLKAVHQIVPSLVSQAQMTELERELSPDLSRRGRPRDGTPKLSDIADALEQVSRADVPQEMLTGLIKRLRSGRRYTEQARALAFHKWIEGRKRNDELSWLCREFYALAVNPELDCHPVLKTWPMPMEGTPSERAVFAAQKVSRELFGRLPPSDRTIRNIISENRASFRERPAR